MYANLRGPRVTTRFYMSGPQATITDESASYAALIQEVHEAEAAQVADRVRAAHDALLAEYPLCFGYWKRLADFEVAQGSVERANEVFERCLPWSAGVAA